MKKNLTELVFILDRSGSMSGMESDTIGGFNSFIEKQKEVEGECLVSTVLFNQISKVVYDRKSLDKVRKMTREDYVPSGSTALIDAMGDAIHHIRNVHKYIRQEDVPEHTVFVIITDGEENSSHKYSAKEVRRMVNKQKEKGWEFIFLGANIDAVETAKNYGIDRKRSATYYYDHAGTQKNYEVLDKAVRNLRVNKAMADDCLEEINVYYQSKQ